MKITSWFFDFDDTLVSAPLTWALNAAIPKLIEQHRLPVEPTRLTHALLTAQERWNRDDDLKSILNDLFGGLGWSKGLQSEFMVDLQTNYQPTLFDDAADLLRGLAQTGHLVYVISNNVNAPNIARQLGMTAYVREVFTPQMFADAQPKPHHSFWQGIVSRYPALRTTTPVLVGDDPWSDGAFADVCGINCWIVDRPGRMEALYTTTSYKWVRSLREIPIT